MGCRFQADFTQVNSPDLSLKYGFCSPAFHHENQRLDSCESDATILVPGLTLKPFSHTFLELPQLFEMSELWVNLFAHNASTF
jgi:hypothetical protein